MASCPTCGRLPRVIRLLAVSPQRPYVCPACGASANFGPRRERLLTLPSVLAAVVVGSLIGSSLAPWTRVALVAALALGAILACRLGLRLHRLDGPPQGDTSGPREPL